MAASACATPLIASSVGMGPGGRVGRLAYFAPMAQEHVELLQAAYEGWKRGDVEPYVSLMHPDLYWEGVSRGVLWWRKTPS